MQASVSVNFSNPIPPSSVSRQAYSSIHPLWVSEIAVSGAPIVRAPHMRSRQARRAQMRQSARAPHLSDVRQGGDTHARLVNRIKRELGPALLPADQSQPAEQSHAEQMMEAYGYQALADGCIAVTNFLFEGARSVANSLPTLSLGVPVGAAPVSATSTPAMTGLPRTSVASFIKEFAKDFDIRVSASSDPLASLQGFTVIIGEDHHDAAIHQRIDQILAHIRPALNDRLLIEGERVACDNRSLRYKIPRKNCHSLEANSAAYQQAKQAKEKLDAVLIDAVLFLNKTIPEQYRQKDIPAHTGSYVTFIQTRSDHLPAHLRSEFQVRTKRIAQLSMDHSESLKKNNLQRDPALKRGIEQHADPKLTNFVLLGAGHLGNLGYQLLEKKSVIVMMPRVLADVISGRSGGDPYRKEL